MTHSLILAIDQGGQSSRVAIYTSTGEQLCCFSAVCTTTITEQKNSWTSFIEQSGEDILAGIRDCLQQIHSQHGDDLRHLCAAGFAGQGSSLLCWDGESGAPLTPVLSWQDTRAQQSLAALGLSQQLVQGLTGLRLSAHYGASKMRWCLDNIPAVAHALNNNSLQIGPIVSYLFWHLLRANNMVDPGHAQRTLLWNLADNNWDNTLLNAFAIPQSVLPACAHHNSHFGDLVIAEHKIPFTASARDQGASLFARGMPEVNACYINIGTGAFIQRVSPTLHAPDGLLVSPLWLPTPASSQTPLYAWEATVNGAASALPFLQQATGLAITPTEIEHALTLHPNGTCYLLNAVGGLSAPYWRTDLASQFSENLSPAEKILAWIESVIFQIVVNVDLMSALGNADKIYISGGLSNASAVCQKIADLTKMPVHRSDNTDATLQGIAYMAGGMPSEWRPLLQDEVFLPKLNAELQRRFKIWQQQMQQWLNS